MSKESKPRDRWRQHYQATRDRPADHCVGCGYHFRVYGEHRADCMVAFPKGADQSTQDWHASYLQRVGAQPNNNQIKDW